MHRLLFFFTLLFAVPLSVSAQSQIENARITNPAAGFFDVTARRAELKQATTPRVVDAIRNQHGCVGLAAPEPPAGRMTIPRHYLEGSNGPVNRAEGAAAAPYRQLGNVVTAGAGRYVATGDPAEAVCAADLLARWAKAGALLNYTPQESSQAWYQTEWTLSAISLGYSVVASDPAIPAVQNKAIVDWMHKVAVYMLDMNPHDDPDHENNHAYWRALAATTVAILSNDEKLYRRELAVFARGVGSMNPDGSWPKEMARHENALHYQDFALSPMILIAELAARQGTDLYSLRVNGHTLADAIGFLEKVQAKPELMKQYATEPQSFSFGPEAKGIDLAWLEFYARRFPQKKWDALLNKVCINSNLGGNATLYAASAR